MFLWALRRTDFQFFDNKILFRFSIEEQYVINYNHQNEEYTFDELLERIFKKSNFEY